MSFLPPRKWPTFAFVAVVGLVLNALAGAPSSAASCSVTAPTVNSGALAIGSLTGATTSGAVREGCTGGWTTAGILTLCNATGIGNDDTGSTRTMTLTQGGVTYSPYQDAGRTTNWGDTVNVDTEPGTGPGSAQTLAVYGRIPPQSPPPAGAYSDTVVATLWY